MAIYFYSKLDQYAAFSNFAAAPFQLDGELWPTVEHYFQAQKFEDAGYREQIRQAATPGKAKSLGRTRELPIRADWNDVKESLMLNALRAKFSTHAELQDLLLSTGDELLIEKSARDYFWGCGHWGTGKNRLGNLLAQVRAELRATADRSLIAD